MDKPLEEDFTLEMIQEELYHSIAEAIGVRNFLTLTEMIGGTTKYSPRKKSVLKAMRDKRISEEYDGHNGRAIAKKCRVSERWVRQLKTDNS